MPRKLVITIALGDVSPENEYSIDNRKVVVDATLWAADATPEDDLVTAAHHALYVLTRDLAKEPKAENRLGELSSLVGRLETLQKTPIKIPELDVDEQKPVEEPDAKTVDLSYSDTREPAAVG